jgi:hypothetical protein
MHGISVRDSIGIDPGVMRDELIASNLDDPHISLNFLKRSTLDEDANQIKGRGDKQNEYNNLTDSKDLQSIILRVRMARSPLLIRCQIIFNSVVLSGPWCRYF